MNENKRNVTMFSTNTTKELFIVFDIENQAYKIFLHIYTVDFPLIKFPFEVTNNKQILFLDMLYSTSNRMLDFDITVSRSLHKKGYVQFLNPSEKRLLEN